MQNMTLKSKYAFEVKICVWTQNIVFEFKILIFKRIIETFIKYDFEAKICVWTQNPVFELKILFFLRLVQRANTKKKNT
jgi:hypothetical protein